MHCIPYPAPCWPCLLKGQPWQSTGSPLPSDAESSVSLAASLLAQPLHLAVALGSISLGPASPSSLLSRDLAPCPQGPGLQIPESPELPGHPHAHPHRGASVPAPWPEFMALTHNCSQDNALASLGSVRAKQNAGPEGARASLCLSFSVCKQSHTSFPPVQEVAANRHPLSYKAWRALTL